MSNENPKTTFSPQRESVDAGTVDIGRSSIPLGKSVLGGPDLGPEAGLLDYMVPAEGFEVEEVSELQAKQNATGTSMHPQSTMIPVGDGRRGGRG